MDIKTFLIIVICIITITFIIVMIYLQRRKAKDSRIVPLREDEQEESKQNKGDSGLDDIYVILKNRDLEYFQYLNQFQCKEYPVVQIYENIINSEKYTTEIALIFSIETMSGYILFVLENKNPERATILFWCKKENYQDGMNYIKKYFTGYTINRRSRLRLNKELFGTNCIIRRKFINHVTFAFWKSRMDYYRVAKI